MRDHRAGVVNNGNIRISKGCYCDLSFLLDIKEKYARSNPLCVSDASVPNICIFYSPSNHLIAATNRKNYFFASDPVEFACESSFPSNGCWTRHRRFRFWPSRAGSKGRFTDFLFFPFNSLSLRSRKLRYICQNYSKYDRRVVYSLVCMRVHSLSRALKSNSQTTTSCCRFWHSGTWPTLNSRRHGE